MKRFYKKSYESFLCNLYVYDCQNVYEPRCFVALDGLYKVKISNRILTISVINQGDKKISAFYI